MIGGLQAALVDTGDTVDTDCEPVKLISDIWADFWKTQINSVLLHVSSEGSETSPIPLELEKSTSSREQSTSPDETLIEEEGLDDENETGETAAKRRRTRTNFSGLMAARRTGVCIRSVSLSGCVHERVTCDEIGFVGESCAG
uniref:Uncharacterized protein n=1 Tax=Caenorhabditis tropicalis TaxID=1561998 RepID=A0A1I7T7S9_9PELO